MKSIVLEEENNNPIFIQYCTYNPPNHKHQEDWISDYKKWLEKTKRLIYTCLLQHYLYPYIYTEQYYEDILQFTVYEKYIEPKIRNNTKTEHPNTKKCCSKEDFIAENRQNNATQCALLKKSNTSNDKDTEQHTLKDKTTTELSEIDKNICTYLKDLTKHTIESLLGITPNIYAYDDLPIRMMTNDYKWKSKNISKRKTYVNMHMANSSQRYDYMFKGYVNKFTLFFKNQCDFKQPLYEIFQYQYNRTDKLYITIESTEQNIANHFKQHNELFLYAMYFNWFPNITFKLKMPKKEGSHQIKLVDFTLLKYLYYLVYDLNQNMSNSRENSITEYIMNGNTSFFYHSLIYALSHGFLFYMNTNKDIIDNDIIILYSISASLISLCLNILGSTFSIFLDHIENCYKQDTLKKQNFFAKVPWYVLYALLRDTMLIYSMYRYRTVPYNLAFQAIIELCIIRKSLFWVPLFKRLWNYNASPEVVFYEKMV